MGLRVTGVGMALCACHEVILPNAVGELQKGERFVMIFLFSHYSEAKIML